MLGGIFQPVEWEDEGSEHHHFVAVPLLGCHMKPLFLTQSIHPLHFVVLSVRKIRGALRCQDTP